MTRVTWRCGDRSFSQTVRTLREAGVIADRKALQGFIVQVWPA